MPPRNLTVEWSPNLSLHEGADYYELVFELAGVTLEDISLTVKENMVTLKGNRPSLATAGMSCVESDISSGPFHSSLLLPRRIKGRNMRAHLEHGLLRLRIPFDPNEPKHEGPPVTVPPVTVPPRLRFGAANAK